MTREHDSGIKISPRDAIQLQLPSQIGAQFEIEHRIEFFEEAAHGNAGQILRAELQMHVGQVKIRLAQQADRIKTVTARLHRRGAFHTDSKIDVAGRGHEVPIRQGLRLPVRVGDDDVIQPVRLFYKIESCQDLGSIDDFVRLRINDREPGPHQLHDGIAMETGADDRRGNQSLVAAFVRCDVVERQRYDLGQQTEWRCAARDVVAADQDVIGTTLARGNDDFLIRIKRRRISVVVMDQVGHVAKTNVDFVGRTDSQAVELYTHGVIRAGIQGVVVALSRCQCTDRRDVDDQRIEADTQRVRRRRAIILFTIPLGDRVENVATDDDVVVARQESRDRRRELGGVGCVDGQRAVLINTPNQLVIFIPHRIGRQIGRVGPETGDRVRTKIRTGPADTDLLAGKCGGGHGNRVNDQIGRGRNRDRHWIVAGGDVVVISACLEDGITRVRMHDQEVRPCDTAWQFEIEGRGVGCTGGQGTVVGLLAQQPIRRRVQILVAR